MIAEPIRKILSAVSERGSKQRDHEAKPASPELRRPGAPRPQPEVCPEQSTTGANPQANFFDVRLHPEAAEVTVPLQAKAVTRGQDVYFHPGQFQPGTPHGETLIAHELAHTLQTRHAVGAGGGPGSLVSQPGDAFEKNADALVRGETTHALAAPAGAALRSPFPSETPAEQQRRENLIRSISNAATTLITLLQTNGLLKFETPLVRNGVRGVIHGPNAAFISYAERDALIRRIIRSLLEMATNYRTAPISTDFTPPVYQPSTGNYVSTVQYARPFGKIRSTAFPSAQPEWAELQSAYERYLLRHGGSINLPPYDVDWLYIEPGATIIPGAAQGATRLPTGQATGVRIVVPDIDHDPLTYWRFVGNAPVPRGSTVIDIWKDESGYYYMYGGQRISVRNPAGLL
jgi:hypothetical protein